MFVRQSEMIALEPNMSLAYWLEPAQAARDFFAAAIAELAARFDAPLFEPHVTVYAGRKGDENPEEMLRGALANCEPFRLSVRDIQCSDEFTKTVFVQFEPSPELLRLNRALQQGSTLHDEYQLNPHLSLIYKEMTLQLRDACLSRKCFSIRRRPLSARRPLDCARTWRPGVSWPRKG